MTLKQRELDVSLGPILGARLGTRIVKGRGRVLRIPCNGQNQ